MATHNYFIQYHNADKLENFPTSGIDFNLPVSEITLDNKIQYDEWIYTSKRILSKAIGSFCFLIVGKTEQRIKNYYLWNYFRIEDSKEKNGFTTVYGTGQDLKKPVLLNNLPEFESFKKFCGNFGIGFQKIDNHPFSEMLVPYILENCFGMRTNKEMELISRLQQLNSKMKLSRPERRLIKLNAILRKDASIVNLLKEIAQYKCQFPDCNSIILTESGTNYVEVAHVKPVFKGGQSIIGNLIVLCPNHHKEFDLGKLSISEQRIELLSGNLNGKNFTIKLIN